MQVVFTALMEGNSEMQYLGFTSKLLNLLGWQIIAGCIVLNMSFH
jgi:hypothetical protein